MKIDGDYFYEDLLGLTEDGGEGTHQDARRVPGAAPLLAAPSTRMPEGCLVAPLGAPFRQYNPPGVETCKAPDVVLTPTSRFCVRSKLEAHQKPPAHDTRTRVATGFSTTGKRNNNFN